MFHILYTTFLVKELKALLYDNDDVDKHKNMHDSLFAIQLAIESVIGNNLPLFCTHLSHFSAKLLRKKT